MKTFRLFLAVVCGASLGVYPAKAFTISSVTFSPGDAVPAGTHLAMIVDIVTPSQGTWLWAPTQVSTNSSGIRVDIYPTSGMLTAIGALRENVGLGAPEPGLYHYEVAIHPNYRVNWGTRTNRGIFIVQKEVLTGQLVLSEPPDGQQFIPGETIPLRATTTSEAGPWHVEFLSGGRRVATSTPNQTVWWSEAWGGQHVISARATGADGTMLTSASATIQVGPDAAWPEVYIWATVPETLEPSSNAPASPGEFTITRLGDTNPPLSLFLEFTGTATFGQDYQEVSQSLVMPAGARKLTVLVGPLDDATVEGDETVIATLSTNPPINSLPNYTVHPRLNQATVVIHDNDFPNDLPVVSISGISTVLEFCPPNAACAGISFSLRRIGPGLDRSLTVFVRYRGTATADVDYRALPGLVTFEAGSDLAMASSIPIDDTLYEGDETIIAEVLPLTTYHVDPNRWQATTIIRDNDPPAPPVVSLELVDPVAMETPGFQNFAKWAEFSVLRTGPATNELVVFLNTQQGSARLGEDYRLDGVNDGSTVRIPPGTSSVNVRLYPIDDDFYEGDETAFFHLIAPPSTSDPYEIDFAHSSVELVIGDNDPVTTRLDITAPRNGQHFEAGAVIELRAQIIGPGSSNSWTVEFLDGNQPIGTTQPGGAIWWQNAIGGEHVINARATSSNGATLEARPVTISVGPGPAWPVVSITARWKTAEPCPVCLVAPGVFTISRTGPTNESLTVYLEYDGTATSGQDYQALPQQITIPAGTNSAELLVLPFDDELVEGPEIVRAAIALPELATRGYIASAYASEAMVVIGDDEAGAPEIRLDIADPKEGGQFAMGTTIEVSALGVWTQGEVDRPVEFFADDRLIGQSDPPQLLRPTIPCLPSVHTIFWTNPPPGRHALTARFAPVPSLVVTSPPVHITVGPTTLPVVRIETWPQDNPQAREFCPPNMDCAYPSFVVRRSEPTNADLRVYLSYSGTATAGADYPSLSASLVIPAGRDAAFLMLVPKDDTLVEGPETVIARFTPVPGPGYIPDPDHGSATITIIDNDLPQPTVVSIRAEDSRATELPPVAEVDPARFRVSRTGDLSRDLLVFFSVGGSASPGADYPELNSPVVIAAGESSVTLDVVPIHDELREGMETILVRLEPSLVLGPLPTYEIDSQARFAVAAIFEGLVEPGPAIEIVSPNEGDRFLLPTAIDIIVAAYHPARDIGGIDFYADEEKIGELRLAPERETSDTVFVHRFTWSQPREGTPALTAVGRDEMQTIFATSAPVRITVGPPFPVVGIAATQRIAEESSAPFRRMNLVGEFTIWRTGPTNEALSGWVHYSGTASNGVDYEALSWGFGIPAGATSTVIRVRAIADDVLEGIETVVAAPSICPPLTDPPLGVPCHLSFQVDPAHESATVFIRDDGITRQSLTITHPSEGATFRVGELVSIEAIAIDLESLISGIEFWVDEELIGLSEFADLGVKPGMPTHHGLGWLAAGPGTHVLTVRFPRADGSVLRSQPVRITVDDAPPRTVVSIRATQPTTAEPCQPNPGEPGPVCLVAPGVFTISRTGSTQNGLFVQLATRGTATPGDDYAPLPSSVEIPAGTGSVQVLVLPQDDRLVEGDETVIAVLLPDPSLGPIERYRVDPEHSEATVVIHDDESPFTPVVSIRATQPNTAEPCPVCLVAPGVFTISRTGPTHSSLVVELAARGTATPGDDYAPLPLFVEIPPGTGSVQVLVLPHDDRWLEGDETVIAVLLPDSSLAPVERYRVDPEHREATVVIHDDESPFVPVVSLTAPQPAGTSECPPGFDCDIEPGVFLLTRTGPGLSNALTVSLRYRGTASPAQDYGALPTTVTFEPNQEAVRLLVVAADDCLIEGTEDVVAELLADPWPIARYRSDPAHYEARVAIEDAVNRALPVVSVRGSGMPPEYCPPNASCVSGGFELTRTGPGLDQPLTVRLRYAGTATAGADYRELPNLVTFGAGRDSVTLFVQPIDDNLVEGDETILAHVVCPDHETGDYHSAASDAPARVVIHDNDPPGVPIVSIARPTSGTEFPANTAIEVVAEARDSDGYVRRVEFFADGRKIGERNLPFTLPPPPGHPQTFTFVWREATPGAHVLTARAIDDDSRSTLSAPVDIRVATDSLPMVTVVATDCFAVEPSSNSLNTASFRLRRFGPTDASLTVRYALRGVAQNGVDYEMLPGSAVIPAGSSSTSIVIRPLADNVREGMENVILEIQEHADYRPGRRRRAGAVIADSALSIGPNGARWTRLPDRGLHLCFIAHSGREFRVEASNDLRDWDTVFTTMAVDDAIHFVEEDIAASPLRFYRIAPEP